MRVLIFICLAVLTVPVLAQSKTDRRTPVAQEVRSSLPMIDALTFPVDTFSNRIGAMTGEFPPKLFPLFSPYTFRILYSRTFNKVARMEFFRGEFGSYTFEVYADTNIIYPENTLAKLQNGDSLVILFSSNGCFHSSSSKLVIYRSAETYEAKLYAGYDGYRNRRNGDGPAEGTLLKSVNLNARQLQAFRKFENELRTKTDSGCTTVDTYTLKSKYLNITNSDGSCSWNGFYHLQEIFFGK